MALCTQGNYTVGLGGGRATDTWLALHGADGMQARVLQLVIFLLVAALGAGANVGLEDKGEKRAKEFDFMPPSMADSKRASMAHGSEDDEAFMTEERRQELRAKQAEARRLKLLKERKRVGSENVRSIIRSSESDSCDWKQQPLAMIRGDLCGGHYKVLGLNRRRDILDKPTIKKAYRLASLSVHPDKNPSEDAQTAFKIVQEAYECLQDDFCKEEYDRQLATKESTIKWQRSQLKTILLHKSVLAMNYLHYHLSVGAHYVFQTGIDIWTWAGEWTAQAAGHEWPMGQSILLVALLWKGQLLLKVQMLAYLIERVNYEIARQRGLL